MRQLVLFSVLLVLVAIPFSVTGKKKVVCYFASWTVYRQGEGKFDVENIDPTLCTHINFAFLGLSQTGSVFIIDPWESDDDGLKGFRRLTDLKQTNPDLKVIASMGGWNEGSAKYSVVAATPAKRRSLAYDVYDFLEKYNFDGFDLDWEYPTKRDSEHPEEDKENFIKLLLELRTVLYPKYLLSAAVSGGVYTIRDSYDIAKMFEILDFVNVMVYDFHGHFEPYVGHVSPLYKSSLDVGDENETLNVAAGINYWLDNGGNADKINMGVVTYGRAFTLADPSNTQLYAPTNGPGQRGPYTGQEGFLGYNEICELHSDWNYYWDDEQKVPHRIGGDQWVGYEDVKSMQLKVEFANSKNLGGIMVWAFDTDDFRGTCGESYPLLKTINKYLQ